MKVKKLLIDDATLVNGSENMSIDYFSINTNDISKNTLFIPLKGNNDGHNYILDNIKNLKGFVCDNNHDKLIKKAIKIKKDIIIIKTDDPLKYLQNLAKKIREEIDVPVIALTGSYGKTSQREMIYSVLSTKFKVLSTKGNYNNHIGLPLTILNYQNEDIILLEMGSNHMGEIEFLRNIAKPTITTITCIGTAHIGNFKSIKNTFKEKSSIIKGSHYFIKNMDDNFIKKIKHRNSICFGTEYDNITNIIHNKKIRYTIDIDKVKYKITINSDLEYLINYSLCAIKIGLILNMNMKDITKGILTYKGPKGRMEKLENNGFTLINDCYNASYETMTSGLKYFYKLKLKNKVVVLGDILELGKKSKKIHKDIAKYILINNLNFKEIHLVGQEMKIVYKILKKCNYNVFYYENVNEIDKEILKGKSLYLKGSHSINLESLIN